MEDLKELEQMPPRSHNGDRLSALEKLAMLHGFDLGMPMVKIAARWTISEITVRRFKKTLDGRISTLRGCVRNNVILHNHCLRRGRDP